MNILINTTLFDRVTLAGAKKLVISTTEGQSIGKLIAYDMTRPDVTLESSINGTLQVSILPPVGSLPEVLPTIVPVIDFAFI